MIGRCYRIIPIMLIDALYLWKFLKKHLILLLYYDWVDEMFLNIFDVLVKALETMIYKIFTQCYKEKANQILISQSNI